MASALAHEVVFLGKAREVGQKLEGVVFVVEVFDHDHSLLFCGRLGLNVPFIGRHINNGRTIRLPSLSFLYLNPLLLNILLLFLKELSILMRVLVKEVFLQTAEVKEPLATLGHRTHVFLPVILFIKRAYLVFVGLQMLLQVRV